MLLHAANIALELGDASVTALVEWTGLDGRSITSLEHRRIIFDDAHHAHQSTFRESLTVQADQVRDALPELVGTLVSPLYELFDFFRLPAALPAEELARMRANRF